MNKRKWEAEWEAERNVAKLQKPGRTLLVGDSILDNRAYADRSTGAILATHGGYLDHSVEETMSKHFKKRYRKVPTFWQKAAEKAGRPYASAKVELYPAGPFDRVVVSVGGNDVVLDAGMIFVYLAGQLQDTISARVLEVLTTYREKYPTADVCYVKPYPLTVAMVDALASRVNIPTEVIPTNMHETLNSVTTGVVEQVRKAGFCVIDPGWTDEDVAISQHGIPEPTTQGAQRLADAILRAQR